MVQVKEQEKKTQLGIVRLPLSRLLNTSNMTLDQRFLLECSGANSQIKLKATLRVGPKGNYIKHLFCNFLFLFDVTEVF